MHIKPMADSDGEFDGWKSVEVEDRDFCCRQCGSHDVWYRSWESNCGGYEDMQYECRGCGRKWWVEGPDA